MRQKSYQLLNLLSVSLIIKENAPSLFNAEFNAGNELVKYGDETLTYDQNGNRTADGNYTYTWNADD